MSKFEILSMRSLLPILSLLIILFLPSRNLKAQNSTDLSFEFQAYPTGLIPGIRFETGLSDQSSILFRLGYNWIRHRDLGVHEDERGDGFGFTIGYKKYFSPERSGWGLALKNDVWWNSIDWTDPGISGQTDITVLQPTLELSYVMGKNVLFVPSIAFGYEWNVKTEGEPTGEGAILLIGFQFGKRF